MHRQIISILFCSSILFSCSKKDSNNNQKEDIIQLQRIENEEQAYTFQYNEQNLLTRIDVIAKRQNGTEEKSGYAEFTYENGPPSTASYFTEPDNGGAFYLRKKTKYVLDAAKRISYTANNNYTESGNENAKDSIDLYFNEKSQVIGVRFRVDDSKSEMD